MTVYLGKNPVGVGRIVEKKVAKEKYGATVDSLLGDVDADGNYVVPSKPVEINLAGVKSIGSKGLYKRFTDMTNIVSFEAEDLETVAANGLTYTFYYCKQLTDINIRNIRSIGYAGLQQAFNDARVTGHLDLDMLETVGDKGLEEAFCYNNITSIGLKNLKTLGSESMIRAFRGTKLITVSFPSLTSVQTNSFRDMFYSVSTMTEIHFRADMQAAIEAMTGYSSKFGATNATIFFDL